ncbi:class I SAM-dependent methyltransferase [Maribacter sp. HTCC2170]|uniref:class I SAM-dependent methyltransferase n=1 Tax=Maribacter sp. (strain HTCC2170 / KCCM 42371) TaxID=313603 RepID=UPI00006B48B9|nr:class I SAM-dependent methyltransferase [Maribacter sp. HTCC2170]EAR01963.1 hypothetical protein FB2170_15583 [Maribacter sp. HTCC2170]
MATAYDPITAKHYAAYRPSLHLPILKKVLDDDYFTLGLDVGCGTGQSAVALTTLYDKVIAIEPSESMLQNAIPHNQVEYQLCNGVDLEFNPNTFEVITFAGVLYYCKSQQLLEEVEKVSKSGAKVIIYDFEILLNDTFEQLGVIPPTKQQLDYDHETNFTDLKLRKLKLEHKAKEQISFDISPTNLAHLLLADNDHYNLLAKKYGTTDIFTTLSDQLHTTAQTKNLTVKAQVFYSMYSHL